MQNRIAGAVDGSSRATLPGTVSGHAKHSVDLGPASGNQKLESLALRFSMTDAQQAALTQLLAAQLNPSSPSYHQWLTPEQFGASFGLSASDLAKVSAWLTSQGFTITSVARSSTFITFSGTVAQAEQAFGTTIHNVSLNGEEHITNLTDPVLPAAIASVVVDVNGLNDFKLQPRSRARSLTTQPLPAFTSTVGGVTSHYIAPGDLYTIYDFPPSSSNLNGSGVTIAVMGQTDLTTGNVLPDPNITAFRTAAGLSAINLKIQLATGSADPGISMNDIDEAHLDIEWSGSAAPSAAILFVNSTDVINLSLPYAIDNKVAPIVTASYGLCEPGWGSSSIASTTQTLQQANAQGMTFFSSAGDAGAADCDSTGLATEGLAVDFPGSSPYSISAGGTMFTGDVSNPSAYWNSANASNNSSALQYIPEQPWNETTVTGGLTAGGAGGGGVSGYFSKPAWQVATGVPNDSSRDVPDVSMNAGAIHDGYVVCSQGSCTNGFLGTNGQPNIFGGTSFVAPTLAGVLALVEQNLGNAPGVGLGNIGPILYGLSSISGVYHDIITGNNIIECSQGTLNCPTGTFGYDAATGYDLASGLGSLDVNMLVTNWANATPTGGGSTIGTALTETTVTTGNALCAVSSGTKVPLTITVTGTTTASGVVLIMVDNVSVGTANLAAGAATGTATASYMLDTTTLSSGGHNISAVYSGDSAHAGSKGTLLGPVTTPVFYPNGAFASFDIVSSTKADFALTPCTGTATAVSVAPGATTTGITFTVTPAAGFTGTVTLTMTNNDSMIATPTFTPATLTFTSATAQTSSFVVQASQASAAQLMKPDLHQRPSSRAPWYAAGSGATLACVLLITLPRRRRWPALLAFVLSVAALSAVGCGGNTSTTGGGGGGGGGGGTVTTPASPGVYTFTITAVSGTLVHSTQVTVTVLQ
jgi:subtilase family serine protease